MEDNKVINKKIDKFENKNKVKDLTIVSIGITIMFAIFWIYKLFIKQYLLISDNLKTIIGLAILYTLGLTSFIFITKNISEQKYEKRKVSFKTIIICFLLQFTALLVLTIINFIISIFTKTKPVLVNALSPYMLIILLIFAPVLEEFVFRHLFAKKLLKHGESFFILSSAICFSVIHGVSISIFQIIYTFILGLIWSYLLVKSGNIFIPIIFHSLSNFFGSILIQLLSKISLILVPIYSFIIIILGIIGLILFIVNKKNINIDGKSKIFTKQVIKEVISNKGILLFVIITIFIMVLKYLLI